MKGKNETLYLQKFTNTNINNACEDFIIRVEYVYGKDSINLVDQNIHIEKKENKNLMDTIGVNLKIFMSQLGYFEKLTEIKNKGGFAKDKDKAEFLENIQKIEANDIKNLLKQICQNIDIKREVSTLPTPNDIIEPEDLSSVDFNWDNIQKYERFAEQKLSDGKTVKQRIDALKEVKRWINDKHGAQRPRVTDLSNEQSSAIVLAFGQRNSLTIQLETKGYSFNSIAEFKKYVDSKF